MPKMLDELRDTVNGIFDILDLIVIRLTLLGLAALGRHIGELLLTILLRRAMAAVFRVTRTLECLLIRKVCRFMPCLRTNSWPTWCVAGSVRWKISQASMAWGKPVSTNIMAS